MYAYNLFGVLDQLAPTAPEPAPAVISTGVPPRKLSRHLLLPVVSSGTR